MLIDSTQSESEQSQLSEDGGDMMLLNSVRHVTVIRLHHWRHTETEKPEQRLWCRNSPVRANQDRGPLSVQKTSFDYFDCSSKDQPL